MLSVAARLLAVGLMIVSAAGARAAVDLNGRAIDPLASPGAHAIVLFFAATDCPISNRYVPEMERLRAEFASDGVRFWFVYPNPADSSAVVSKHDAQFSIVGNTALDTDQRLVQRAHVTTTPETAVFIVDSSSVREVYHGRIDDRYFSFGHERPRAMHHDLEEAIQDALAHRPVPPSGGGPVGCAIIPLHQ